MIARLWRGGGGRGATPTPTSGTLTAQRAAGAARRSPGYRGGAACCGAKTTGEFLVMTFWESMDAIRRFAGEDPGARGGRARGARGARASTTTCVRHYEVHGMNRIDAVRRFNRFYTRRVGALQPHYLGSPYLAAAGARALRARPARRVHGERARRRSRPRPGLPQPPAAGPEAQRPGAGRGGEGGCAPRAAHADREGPQGLPAARRALARRGGRDARRSWRRPSRRGWSARCRPSSRCWKREAGEQRSTLRAHRPGDMGWVVRRARPPLRARSTAGTSASRRWSPGSPPISSRTSIRSASAAGSPRWMASRSGCVFVVKKSKTVAKLRLLIVEPRARGMRPRPAAGGRVHRVRAREGLSQARAVDAVEPGRGAAHLPGGRVSSS